jgi:hypothetical protein
MIFLFPLALLASCGTDAYLETQTPWPLDIEVNWLEKENHAEVYIWLADTIFFNPEAAGYLQDAFWTMGSKTVRNTFYLPLPDGSDGRADTLVRFTIVDLLGDTLSKSERMKLPLWVQLVSPVEGYQARVGDTLRFLYRSNQNVPLWLWQNCDSTKTSPLESMAIGLKAGEYCWGVDASLKGLSRRFQVLP